MADGENPLLRQLAERELPELLPRGEMLRRLQAGEYGFLDETAGSCSAGAPRVLESRLCGGSVQVDEVPFTVRTARGSHTFPVVRLLQNDGARHPLLVFMNFAPGVPAWYYPAELLAERGVCVLSFCYTDACTDDADFENGAAKLLLGAPRGREAGGKLAVWAWCAQRLLDYGLTLPQTDAACTAVVGHSRLGKTALLAAAQDARFRFVYSCCAGCGGDSLARGSLGAGYLARPAGAPDIAPGAPGRGESFADITRNFPFWFCGALRSAAGTGVPEGFDQHFLLACCAPESAAQPRFVYVSSSSLDDWADPRSQQLCCLAAGRAWQNAGLPGLEPSGRFLLPGERLHAGCVGCHVRAGRHFLSWHDWDAFLDFLQAKRRQFGF